MGRRIVVGYCPMESPCRGPSLQPICIESRLCLLSQTIANAIVIFMVQCFFIRRIWVLSGYKLWLASILSVLALMTLGGGMFFGINEAGRSTYSKFNGVCGVSLLLRAKTYIADE